MMGRTPTLTSGFGTVSECSRRRVPSPPQKSTTFMTVPVVTSETQLPAVKGFREAAGCRALDAADARERAEGIRCEPRTRALRWEALHEAADLVLELLGGERDVDVRVPEVALVLRDLVLEHEVRAERVPGQLRDEPVVLVPVVQMMREDDVGRDLRLDLLERFLDQLALGRHEGVAEVVEMKL